MVGPVDSHSAETASQRRCANERPVKGRTATGPAERQDLAAGPSGGSDLLQSHEACFQGVHERVGIPGIVEYRPDESGRQRVRILVVLAARHGCLNLANEALMKASVSRLAGGAASQAVLLRGCGIWWHNPDQMALRT